MPHNRPEAMHVEYMALRASYTNEPLPIDDMCRRHMNFAILRQLSVRSPAPNWVESIEVPRSREALAKIMKGLGDMAILRAKDRIYCYSCATAPRQ